MERDCDELELELDLGLSIGGTFRRKETTNVKEIGVEDESMHELRKREMHALRRQEAKKKRDEKQQRKGKGKRNERIRVRERESTKKHEEEEEEEEERGCKRGKVQKLHVSKNNKDLNLNLISNENPSSAFQPFPHPQYSYPQMQYLTFPNGYAFGPYVMPYSTPEASSSENKAVALVRPLASRSFVPYRAPGGCALAQNSNLRKENDESSWSPKGSSSVISDYQSSSYQGGSSTDTGSQSSHLKPDYELNGSTANHEHIANCNETSHSHAQMTNNTTFSEKMLATVSESNSIRNDEERKTIDPSKRTISSIENPTTDPAKEAEVNTGKPMPMPMPMPMPNQSTSTVPQMPFVSTTGNGPNGKKITGFLYKYSMTEVSIVCVCHGTSFSPSEFILHAGGTDITNPLKHITVIPSPFLG